MHVVVVGCGRVGSELAGTLEKSGHTVAIIDKNPRRSAACPASFAGRSGRRASASTATTCIEAGIERRRRASPR